MGVWTRGPDDGVARPVVVRVGGGCGRDPGAGCGGTAPPAGLGISATTSSGTSPWTRPVSAVNAGHPITAISCPTPTFCLALNDADTSYRYDGTSWSPPFRLTSAGPAPSPPAASISCTGPTFCMAVPGANDAVNGNGAWLDAHLLGGPALLRPWPAGRAPSASPSTGRVTPTTTWGAGHRALVSAEVRALSRASVPPSAWQPLAGRRNGTARSGHDRLTSTPWAGSMPCPAPAPASVWPPTRSGTSWPGTALPGRSRSRSIRVQPGRRSHLTGSQRCPASAPPSASPSTMGAGPRVQRHHMVDTVGRRRSHGPRRPLLRLDHVLPRRRHARTYPHVLSIGRRCSRPQNSLMPGRQ